MPKSTASAAKNLRYRQRLRAAGGEEVLFQLPRETVAMLDELKERQGRATAQQQIT